MFSHVFHTDSQLININQKLQYCIGVPIKLLIPVSVYNKRPRLSLNYDTIKQVDVEAASKLRDYAFAMTDQTAQHQKLLLENEIAYENHHLN